MKGKRKIILLPTIILQDVYSYIKDNESQFLSVMVRKMDSLYDFPTFQLLKSKGTLNIPYNKPVSPHQLFTNDATNNLKIKYLYSVFLLEYIYFPCLNFTFTLCETNTSKRFFYIYIVSLLRSSQYKFQELHRIII